MIGSRLKLLVVPGLLGVLVVQFAFSRLSEPYPAVLLPGFGSVPGVSGMVDVPQYRITATSADGQTFVDDGSRILGSIFTQYRAATLDFILSDGDPNGLGPFDAMRARNRLRNERYLPGFRDWLRSRLGVLTGRTDWDSVVFERFDRAYDLGRHRLTDPGEPAASWVVTLR